MTLKIEGLVLRAVKYGESDKLITILTEEGKIFFKARGIRSLTSKNAAGCTAFVYSEFELEQRGDKCYLKRAVPLYATVRQGADVVSLALASYLAELAEDTARDAETGKTVLRLLMNALFLIAKEDRPADLIKSVFEMRLLVANGLMPNLSGCASCGKGVDEVPSFFFRLLDGDLICPDCINSFDTELVRVRRDVIALCMRSIEAPEEKAYALKVPEGILRDFSRFTERYLLCQLERDYRTLDFYRQVKKLSAPAEEKNKKETQEERQTNGNETL
ncbi:MAG: DNA repair protein RecO [Ruminococcaceae bacterium]|nr:DNA repair protein RecO [Oscillospiraceae bacterium]